MHSQGNAPRETNRFTEKERNDPFIWARSSLAASAAAADDDDGDDDDDDDDDDGDSDGDGNDDDDDDDDVDDDGNGGDDDDDDGDVVTIVGSGRGVGGAQPPREQNEIRKTGVVAAVILVCFAWSCRCWC